MSRIAYRSGYLYQLAADYSVTLEFAPAEDIETDFIKFDRHGVLTVLFGYAWDGPSGPMVDTESAMRASLEHDALYQMLRMRLLDPVYRKAADLRFRQCYLEDAEAVNARRPALIRVPLKPIIKARAAAAYRALRLAGGPSADPANDRPVLWAPAMEITT